MRQTKRQPNTCSLRVKVYWACAFLVICAPRVTSATPFPQESNANARLANAAQGQEIVDNALQFEHLDRIDSRKRLVEQQKTGLNHQGPGNSLPAPVGRNTSSVPTRPTRPRSRPARRPGPASRTS